MARNMGQPLDVVRLLSARCLLSVLVTAQSLQEWQGLLPIIL